ncbi:GNAT family N-acetyltransferase [Psychromarinibacter sp. C21-152]|uniref:GNAT family N-acetyltransferase n=1 Tax=Psychromarinibacter sediminicola TaxID=3033385 RepID=A0AAE3TCC7_9RHOB|nr:GNAT family N-acetyltransferase [Psychromarinibacter sediminicola]MDF0603834.1 GNAT family N-acetyltransferase [Psychromarinibacter sediminicola]
MDIHWNRLDRRAWAAALPDTACALQQSWRYGAAVAAMGRRVHRAEIWKAGRFYGLAQVLLRRAGPLSAGLVLRGPVWMDRPADTREALRALRRAMPGPGARLLLAQTEGPGPGILPLVTPVAMAEIGLGAATGAMRARMHGKWRNRLRRAEAAGLSVAVTAPSAADLDWLCRLDRQRAGARGYRGLPPAFLAAWAACEGPPMRLFTARLRGDTVAAMLFLDHPPGVTYQIGWTGVAGRAVAAHNLLLWRAMRHFARDGRRRLDLGPLDTETAPGLARFKLGAGAAVRRLSAAGPVLPALTRGRAAPAPHPPFAEAALSGPPPPPAISASGPDRTCSTACGQADSYRYR